MAASPASAGYVNISYLYNLSDFTGAKPFSSAKITWDSTRNEIYGMVGESVSVFNSNGMEVFRFDYDPTIGLVNDAAVTSQGDLVILASKGQQTRLVRCNFRAEPQGTIPLQGLPAEFAGFTPNRMLWRDNRFYLVSNASMQMVVVDNGGNFITGYDIAKILGLSEKERGDMGIGGCTLGPDGSLYLSTPATAKVYRILPDGTIKGFGRRGSAPGRFGVPSGVALDRDGNLIVADMLRCVIMVFDSNFTFIREFGTRGLKPGQLIAPGDILVDGDNKLYVSNLRKRGVNVYQLSAAS